MCCAQVLALAPWCCGAQPCEPSQPHGAMPCDAPGDDTGCSGGPRPWAVYCSTCGMWLNGSA
eukprot:7013133-Lingulodinium_polyedra.AAC.1